MMRLSAHSSVLQTKQTIASLLLTLLPAIPVFAIENGQTAPEFTLQGSKGNLQLSDYKGKIIYLDFWASWCGPCKQSFPWMNSIQSKFNAHGIKVIAVNLDANKEDAKRFLESVPANFDIAYDPKGILPRQYAVKGMPTSILIDRDGKVIAQHAGFNDGTRAQFEQTIQSLIGVK